MSSPALLAAVGWPLIGGIIGAIVTWFGLVSGVWSFLVGLAVAGFVVAAPALSRRQARRRWLGYPYSRALVVSQVASGVALLVLFVVVAAVGAKAWQRPGWPGVREAAGVPEACHVLSEDQLATVVAAQRLRRLGEGGSCQWSIITSSAGTVTGPAVLTVVYLDFHHDRHDGGARQAHRYLRAEAGYRTQARDVGDECCPSHAPWRER
jgi:hypothetical protein